MLAAKPVGHPAQYGRGVPFYDDTIIYNWVGGKTAATNPDHGNTNVEAIALAIQAANVQAKVGRIREFRLLLPCSKQFIEADLSQNLGAEIQKVEGK